MGFIDIKERPEALKINDRINWKAEATYIELADEMEYNSVVDQLSKYPTVRYCDLEKWHLKTSRSFFKRYAVNYGKCWCNTDRTHEIYVCEFDNDHYNYIKYYFLKKGSKLAEETDIKGTDSFRTVTENVYLSYVKDRPGKEIIDTVCNITGQPLIYSEPNNGFILPYDNVYKADYSSAYPSCAYDIPTYKDHKLVKGFVEPDDDYPFAFQNNGNLIIKELDGSIIRTTDIKSPLDNYKYDYEAMLKSVDKPETLLLKRDETNNLFKYFNQLYDIKNTTTDNNTKLAVKGILNTSIGYMRSFKYNIRNYCGYISAVCYLRHLYKMTSVLNQLKNQKVLSVLTDSVIWQGKNIGLDTTKTLGKLVLEENNATVLIRETGQYVFIENGKLRKETLHNMGYSDEIKDYINTTYDFKNMSKIAANHNIKNNILKFDMLTRKYI